MNDDYAIRLGEIESLIEDDKSCNDKVDSLFQTVCEDGFHHIDYAPGYSEPGYTCGEKGVVFADWNTESKWNQETQKFVKTCDFMSRFGSVLESAGYELEWCDEWFTCGDCNLAVRSSGDSYGWQPHYHIFDGEVACGDCIQQDPVPYLEDIAGNPRKAVTFEINLEEHGYSNVLKDFETGLYGGQADDPEKIAGVLTEAGVEDFVFSIDYVGQFDMRFSVYVKHDSLHDASVALENNDITCDVDPAVVMKQGLETASKMMATLPEGPGIKVAKIGKDVSVKLVSPEDFVSGKALD